MEEIVNFTINKLKNVLESKKWDQIVVGFSGGKDSTCVVQLLLDCIIKNNIKIPVKILSSDTLIENPLISKQIKTMHNQINYVAKQNNLDIDTKILYPKITDSYFYNTIVKGYATPLNTKGRWCTRALKVDPMEEYYKNISEKTLLLTGVRIDESQLRKRNIENFFEGIDVKQVRTNLFSYPIIKKWKLSDVWDYIMDVTRSDDYYLNTSSLWEIYRDATTDDVCPSSLDMSIENSAKSCGNSRYGCYLCPLVRNDRTLDANIKNGHKELLGYQELREYYIARCYNPKFRDRMDRRGNVRFKEVKHDLINNILSFSLLNTKYRGYPADFNVINVENLESAATLIKDNTEIDGNTINGNIFNHTKKEVLFKVNDKYFAVRTGRLSFRFRIEFFKKIIQIERKYEIRLMNEIEKKYILQQLENKFKTIEGEEFERIIEL